MGVKGPSLDTDWMRSKSFRSTLLGHAKGGMIPMRVDEVGSFKPKISGHVSILFVFIEGNAVLLQKE